MEEPLGQEGQADRPELPGRLGKRDPREQVDRQEQVDRPEQVDRLGWVAQQGADSAEVDTLEPLGAVTLATVDRVEVD